MSNVLVYEDKQGNKVFGKPFRVIGTYKFVFRGKNSTIYIGENVTFKSLIIDIKGDDNQVSIGRGSRVYGRILTQHTGSQVLIGENLRCNGACRMHAAEGRMIKIGNNCLFSNVRFRVSDSHSIIDLANNERINQAGDIIIEDRVWIAEEVYIYKGISIGTGAVVGARATVTRSLPKNALCVGSPAKAVKLNISWDANLL